MELAHGRKTYPENWDLARRADVGQGADVTWVVMADPEGNEFCVLRPLAPEQLAAN